MWAIQINVHDGTRKWERGITPTMEIIHKILGGKNIVEDSLAARKAYAHQALQVDSIARVKKDEDPIIFTLKDQGDVLISHDDSLVISIVIAKHPIERILMDKGSSINLLY